MQSIDEDKRFTRQITLPEVGSDGQERLSRTSVFLVGCGGLASSAAYYLVAAGIGRIGIADDDRVEISNLNRQILHTTSRIGMPKVDSAQRALKALHPAVEIQSVACRLTSAETLIEILAGYDFVIDGTDNYAARQNINHACLHLGIPWVYGAVSGFEGQAMTIVPGKGPCYRCLYPSAPVDIGKMVPSIGVAPGMVGMVQATEAIKQILGIGRQLLGRMLFFDLLEMEVSEFKVQRNATCPACGTL